MPVIESALSLEFYLPVWKRKTCGGYVELDDDQVAAQSEATDGRLAADRNLAATPCLDTGSWLRHWLPSGLGHSDCTLRIAGDHHAVECAGDSGRQLRGNALSAASGSSFCSSGWVDVRASSAARDGEIAAARSSTDDSWGLRDGGKPGFGGLACDRGARSAGDDNGTDGRAATRTCGGNGRRQKLTEGDALLR